MLPLNDLTIAEFLPLEYHVAIPVDGRYSYYPDTTEVQEASAARTQNVSHKILADVEFTESSEGVIVAQGSRFGGYTIFVKDHQLVYVNNFLGVPPEQRVSAPAPTSGRHVVGIDFKKETTGEHHEAHGTLTLYVDDDAVSAAPLRTQLGRYALTGEGLCVGYDSGDVVSAEYGPGFGFTGGTIHKVVYDVADDAYIDLDHEFGARLASD